MVEVIHLGGGNGLTVWWK